MPADFELEPTSPPPLNLGSCVLIIILFYYHKYHKLNKLSSSSFKCSEVQLLAKVELIPL